MRNGQTTLTRPFGEGTNNLNNHVYSNVNNIEYTPMNNRRYANQFLSLLVKCITGNMKYRSNLRERGDPEAGNSASNIDIWCR